MSLAIDVDTVTNVLLTGRLAQGLGGFVATQLKGQRWGRTTRAAESRWNARFELFSKSSKRWNASPKSPTEFASHVKRQFTTNDYWPYLGRFCARTVQAVESTETSGFTWPTAFESSLGYEPMRRLKAFQILEEIAIDYFMLAQDAKGRVNPVRRRRYKWLTRLTLD